MIRVGDGLHGEEHGAHEIEDDKVGAAQEPVEIEAVPTADALPSPGAVMIVAFHTDIAISTVLGSSGIGFDYLAAFAICHSVALHQRVDVARRILL